MPTPPVQEPSKIGSFLQQANSLFNSAKTYTPYIQQAMPMVKNIPSLLKLYKGFSGLPAAGAVAGAAAAATDAAAASNVAGSSRSRRSTQKVRRLPRDNHFHRSRAFSSHLWSEGFFVFTVPVRYNVGR